MRKTVIFVTLLVMVMIGFGCSSEKGQEQGREQSQGQIQEQGQTGQPSTMMGCEEHCAAMDTDHDGKVTLEEFMVVHTGVHAEEMFKTMDTDEDSALTVDEFCAGKGKRMMPQEEEKEEGGKEEE